MARNLAHVKGSEQDESSRNTSEKAGVKSIINRREYLLVGAGAVATTLAGGPTMAGAQTTEETLSTDFSEYIS